MGAELYTAGTALQARIKPCHLKTWHDSQCYKLHHFWRVLKSYVHRLCAMMQYFWGFASPPPVERWGRAILKSGGNGSQCYEPCHFCRLFNCSKVMRRMMPVFGELHPPPRSRGEACHIPNHSGTIHWIGCTGAPTSFMHTVYTRNLPAPCANSSHMFDTRAMLVLCAWDANHPASTERRMRCKPSCMHNATGARRGMPLWVGNL